MTDKKIKFDLWREDKTLYFQIHEMDERFRGKNSLRGGMGCGVVGYFEI